MFWLRIRILLLFLIYNVLVQMGPRNTFGNVSDCRYVSDCRSRGRKVAPDPDPYFRGD